MNVKDIFTIIAAVFAATFLLGSSVCGGDPSPAYESRWYRGNAQETLHWTADYSRVVFGHLGRIYIADADGGNIQSVSGSTDPVRLYTDTTKIDFSPYPSPDGSQVVYATLRYAEGDIWSYNTWEIAAQPVDGSKPRRLTNNDWDDVSPAWSPDGSRIAFVSNRGDGYRIFTMAPDGSNQRSRAPSITAFPDAPVWSPDGTQLAFVAMESQQQVLYVANAEGTGLTKIPWPDGLDADLVPNKPYSSRGQPSLQTMLRWSPDGERIAFVAHRQQESDAVLLAGADGSEARQIFHVTDIIKPELIGSTAPVQVHNVAWSLDGSEIGIEAGTYAYSYPKERFFFVERGPAYPVASAFMVGADGSNLRLVADPGNTGAFPEWAQGLVGIGPDRIRMHYVETEDKDSPSWARVRHWTLSAISWDGYTEQVLALTDGERWLAGNPAQRTASEEAGRCSRWRVGGNPLTNGGLVRDCRTLLEIWDVLAGDAIRYWNADVPVRDWPGITVEGRLPRVTELYSVPAVMLNGRIPPELGKIDRLRTLALANNDLTGSIPPELGNLTSLRVLDLGGNSFTGAIPAELGNLASLVELNLSYNPLDGPIPPELGKLNHLRVLYLGGRRNQLTGTIPPELGSLLNLQELIINWTKLSGPIPPELGDLSQLRILHLRGTPKAGFGLLSGPIPPELGKLKNLSELMLEDNQLSGVIPPELGDLIPDQGGRVLHTVYLGGNRFTGCAPAKLQQVWERSVDMPFCN